VHNVKNGKDQRRFTAIGFRIAAPPRKASGHRFVRSLLLVLAVAGSGSAQGAAGSDVPLPREVVLLVGRTVVDIEAPLQDAARELLQMPSDWLGLRLVRHGVDREAPPDLDPTRVLAVGTWFENDVQVPTWVWPWLERQPRQLKKLHFGSIAPLCRDDGGEALRSWLRRCGLGFDTTQIADPTRIEIEWAAGIEPFESQPVYERLHHGPWSLGGENRVWLATRDLGRARHARHPVVSGPWGGIALQPWFARVGGAANDRRLYVDPFAFLTAALALGSTPVPDPCVRFGRRLFVLHVDGDGFESVSTVEAKKSCGEVFRDRIVDRWQVPMTVSFIVAGLTDRLHPEAPTERMLLARDILARPWVEAASHSVLHPLNWRERLHPRSLPRSVVWYPELNGFAHDMAAEVRESISFIDRWLLPEGKRCRVMLWSGAANPDEPALAAAAAAGCWNLNGGLFRWDSLHDSVGFVSGHGVKIGEQFQVFAGAPNENVFAGFFTTMPGAFQHVDQTIANTGRDRILKPANVYVHFYSAEHPARLRALETLLARWLDQEAVFPAPASTYCGAVDDCQRRCTIVRSERGFLLSGFEHCRTVRFDGEAPAIDWTKSRGLAGWCTLQGRTFVHLAAADAEIALLPAGTASVAPPHLAEADHELAAIELQPGAVRFDSLSAQRRSVRLAGWPPEHELTIEGLPGASAARSDRDGRLLLQLPPGERLSLRVAAVSGAR
jgi:polysaccharide biosynthesis protein PelA